MNNKLEVIGIDHGWSMMKTISQVFVTGVKEITTTPALFGDVLEYEGKFYKVGTVRQEVKDTKVEDDSFYLLTLAAVAKELKRRGLAEAKVFLAVGLPLTRFGAEKNDFIKYLTKNKRVSFKYENESYHIEIGDVAVFPQCYAAVVDKIPAMAKKTLIVDIGSWTIDIMPVINKSPDESKCVTIPKGLITCMRSINEQCVRQLNGEVDESEIQNIMRYGRSDIDDEYFAIIKAEIEDFVDKVYNSIREFGYNLKTTRMYEPTSGEILLGAENISELPLPEYRNMVSVVSQQIYLFNDTIRNNICLYKQIDDTVIEAACKDSGLEDFIKEVSLDHVVGQNGAMLSGGQKQKIALARALVHDKPIIIFDEATSNTDAYSEQQINGLLDTRLKDKTVIVITHKKEILSKVDQIVVLKEGVVADLGRYDDLIGKSDELNVMLEKAE